MTQAQIDLTAIEVDLLRPEDAAGVAELFRLVYGDGYPVRDYYDPQALIAANQAGRIISSVARTPEGRVVGHNALFNHVPHPHTHESGAGLVHPDFRAGDLFGRMTGHGPEVSGPAFGVETIWGEPLCSHVYSQKVCHGLGWITMAVEVELMPAATYARERSAQGRVSTLLDFCTLVPAPQVVYLPAPHERALREIYSGFDDAREFQPAQGELPDDGPTLLENRIIEYAQVTRITIQRAGADLDQAMAAAEAEALGRGVVVFQVWLSLGEPWAGAVAEALRRRGYFLGGPLPRWFGPDGLLMQKLASPPDWSAIHLEFNRAKRLLELVRADYETIREP